MSAQRKTLQLAAAVLAAACCTAALAAQSVVHLYNWNDYFAPDTLPTFEARTGIRPVLDVYDANGMLEARLFAGNSGYDLIFPTATPFAARHVQAGLYRPLDRARLPGWDRLDPAILGSLAAIDPGNRHLVPYLWGTTGIGVNLHQVTAALGRPPEATWGLLFEPASAAKLAGCGIALLDDTGVYSAALAWLGRDPNSTAADDLDAADALLRRVRPHVRYFHSSQYVSDLANGDVCIAMGSSGDVLQARTQAQAAGNGAHIAYLIPREGP